MYYNEIDPYAAKWLENLSDAGHIVSGQVDRRSIVDVQPDEVGEGQAHFFAGIGAWSLALRLAGIPDDFSVWTGSCPCQPFSVAGKQKGEKDERHLWPEWRRLIAECLPPIIFGEQVASPSGRDWLATVRSELEELGYVVGASDLCAAGVGAPHIRQRLFFGAIRLADRRIKGLERHSWNERFDHEPRWHNEGTPGPATKGSRIHTLETPRTVSFIHSGAWVLCRTPTRDSVWRPIEPGTFPMAYGTPNRVGRVRAYGNTIVPQVAAHFISSFMEAAYGD